MSETIENKISGVIENVVFRNEENGFTVLEISSGGEIITAVGVLADIAAGEEVALEGKWDSHTLFGRQFKISSCVRSLPDTAAKLYRYLASGAIKGIGPKTAMKIIERFGERSFEVLECEPEKLAVIKGISRQKATEISTAFNTQYAMRKVIIELESYGITPAECAAIFKFFGINAVNTIRENPYALCCAVRGFTFERADLLKSKMQLEPKPIYRNEAGIIYVLKHNLGNGHTCIPRKKMYTPCENLLEISEDETDITIDSLLSRRLLVQKELSGEEFLFLPEVYNAEKTVADRMKEIISFPPSLIKTIDADIDGIESKNTLKYAEKQREAIRLAAQKGILILTGGPGTGKTTAVKGIIDIFERRSMHVLLCAPTGRAAKRMSEVTGREAKTIHRLLEVEWDESDTPVFRRNRENPLTASAVIVDEMSMVDIQLFSSFLDALPIGCRIVLVGDSDQLPSVGAGNVLNDLIQSEALPVVCLNEIFRQAQESLIVMNAHRIISGEMPCLNAADNDFFFMHRENSVVTARTVASLISSRLPQAYGFSPLDDIQILCPSRKGDCGTVNLNRMLQEILNPKDKTKSEVNTSGGRIFREGDRVMQIKNNYNIEWETDDEDGCGVFNGDIGILKKINYGAGIMTVMFDQRKTDYPIDNLSELELAYAVTVHKSQGSEYNAVIVPLIDCPPMLMYRNLLYTAVTRAKKMLIIVGNEQRVKKMVMNDCQTKRYSALKAFLQS